MGQALERCSLTGSFLFPHSLPPCSEGSCKAPGEDFRARPKDQDDGQGKKEGKGEGGKYRARGDLAGCLLFEPNWALLQGSRCHRQVANIHWTPMHATHPTMLRGRFYYLHLKEMETAAPESNETCLSSKAGMDTGFPDSLNQTWYCDISNGPLRATLLPLLSLPSRRPAWYPSPILPQLVLLLTLGWGGAEGDFTCVGRVWTFWA